MFLTRSVDIYTEHFLKWINLNFLNAHYVFNAFVYTIKLQKLTKFNQKTYFLICISDITDIIKISPNLTKKTYFLICIFDITNIIKISLNTQRVGWDILKYIVLFCRLHLQLVARSKYFYLIILIDHYVCSS